MPFKPSELILNSRGAVFHLDLLPHEVADHIVVVGDPGRVTHIGKELNDIEFERVNREFVTITGSFGDKRVSIVSTGIGTDNLDIVVSELDFLASLNLEKREELEEKRKLRMIRLGTCGILQENIPPGAFIRSQYSIGFDALMHFYKTEESYESYQLKNELKSHLHTHGIELPFYVGAPQGEFALDVPERHLGLTATLPGFYGPQGRDLRVPLKYPDFIQRLTQFESEGLKFVNFEMESSGLFGMASALGHDSACICLGLANRITGEVLKDPSERMQKLIAEVLEAV